MSDKDVLDFSIIGWLLKHKIKTESGQDFDLYSHPFWYDFLTDKSPKIVLLKCAQVGGTSATSFKMVWSIKNYGLNCAYTMPTADDVKEFVGGRLNSMIRLNPVLDSWIADKDSVEQKQIGDNFVFFKGTMTERSGLSFPADLIVHDEEDRSNRKFLEQFGSRQLHSRFQWKWHLSNPSTPGNGVDKYWQLSDKKEWYVTCTSCFFEQTLEWPHSIDTVRECYQCKKCLAELPDENRRRGTWLSTSSGEYSGYHISLLMAPWVPASKIIREHRDNSPEYFHNFILGLPYAGSGNKLNENEFFANLKPALTKYDDPIVIGIDPGIPNWYVVGNKDGVFFHGKSQGWEEIKQLLRRFPRAIAVCDQGGDLYGPRNLQEEFPGRVYLCWFRTDRKTMRLVDWGEGKNTGAVYADRNRCIQQVIDELRMQRLPFYGQTEDWLEPWQHFANLVKEVEEDGNLQPRFVWKRNGPDHLALCFTYYRVGLTKFESGDGSRYTKPPDRFREFTKIINAPVALPDGQLLMPKQTQDFDWRDVN